jgi:NAD(P)-dependent dehydrogenase (short-subunit alcohol dehydrogenase family)
MDIANLFSVAGKTVLITGGSSGLGLMMATGFLKAGARVYISARKAEQLQAAQHSLSPWGEVHAVRCDLATPEGVGTLSETLLSREQHLHVLVNNAGKSWGAPFEQYPDSAWPGLMALNVQAPFILTQRLMPLLAAAASAENPARVINIGSIAGLGTDKLNAFAYGPSKAALHQLTRMLAQELAPRHILVNAIAPGLFPSKMSAAIMKDEGLREEMRSSIPLQRFGTPEDIAGLAIYLSARAGAFMTGNIITLDGGSSASLG